MFGEFIRLRTRQRDPHSSSNVSDSGRKGHQVSGGTKVVRFGLGETFRRTHPARVTCAQGRLAQNFPAIDYGTFSQQYADFSDCLKHWQKLSMEAHPCQPFNLRAFLAN